MLLQYNLVNQDIDLRDFYCMRDVFRCAMDLQENSPRLLGSPVMYAGLSKIRPSALEKFPRKPLGVPSSERPEFIAPHPWGHLKRDVPDIWDESVLRTQRCPCDVWEEKTTWKQLIGTNSLRTAGRSSKDPNAWAKSSLGSKFETDAIFQTHIWQASVAGKLSQWLASMNNRMQMNQDGPQAQTDARYCQVISGILPD